MIVQCENCETRFHVADARIPEKGARVRCSRCHHRFHITPSSGAPTGQGTAADVSARPVPRGPEAGGGGGGEGDLDNPEFLFEENTSPDRVTQSRAAAAPEAPEPAPPPPAPQAEEAKPPSPDLEPGPAPEERVVETRGKTAQEMLDAGAPKLGPTTPAPFESNLLGGDSDDTRSRFFLGEEPPAEREAPPSLRPAKDKPAKPAPPPPPAAKAKPAPKVTPAKSSPALAKPSPTSEIDAAFGAGLSDEDEGDAGWESLTKDSEPRSVFDAGASFGLVSATDSGPVAPTKNVPATLFDQPEAPAAPAKKGKSRNTPAFDPEAGSSLGVILRVAACLVGIALLGGALRGLSLQRQALTAGVQAEQGGGWTATDLETFVARDSLGTRVLVVRGNLFAEGAAPPPQVEVSLMESDGRSVGEPRRAWLERLDDAEISPDQLSVRLASNDGQISGLGPQVTGFTALLADPPANARRVRVTLNGGRALPPGTATATTPPAAPAPTLAPAPAPAPAPSQPAESQFAAPPPPANPPPPAPDAVVPAAPEPE
jgi:predicted Zn finger-like uncharacterized protein